MGYFFGNINLGRAGFPLQITTATVNDGAIFQAAGDSSGNFHWLVKIEGDNNFYNALYYDRDTLWTVLNHSSDLVYVSGGNSDSILNVDDLDAAEQAVKDAGYTPKSHADYEPGRRFYFEDEEGVEYELVQYD